jgi:hypothetical protein
VTSWAALRRSAWLDDPNLRGVYEVIATGLRAIERLPHARADRTLSRRPRAGRHGAIYELADAPSWPASSILQPLRFRPDHDDWEARR